jgi:hypothetical protein
MDVDLLVLNSPRPCGCDCGCQVRVMPEDEPICELCQQGIHAHQREDPSPG